MRIVTGADGGLGETILELARTRHEEVFNLPAAVIRGGKQAIDEWIGNIDGPVEWVVNNYGINHLSWIGSTPEEDEEILRINMMGPYWVINALAANGHTPRVVNIASATYRVPQRCTALYCASKAGLVQMTKVMARELAPKGWVINALAPGLIVDTDMARLTMKQVIELRDWDPKEAEDYALSLVPCGRYTRRHEVAQMVMSILDMPSYVNGTIIDMMGGV
jgi:NAD(P)-dependent dehydrogenase (short-subunit alcohol dehydrogenase family)